MPKPLVKLVKLNGLPYNVNHDPQVYRRCVNEAFRIQALLDGAGTARCVLSCATSGVLKEDTIALPGTFTHELSFPAPGTRIVTLTIVGSGERFTQDLRLDVLEHAWLG